MAASTAVLGVVGVVIFALVVLGFLAIDADPTWLENQLPGFG